MNLNLIGARGAGKSNISRRLSGITKRSIMSTDMLIQYENGQTIAEIVAQPNGWQNFRNLEFEVLKKLTALDNVIVDCGGGIVVDLDPDGNEIFSERKVSLLRDHGPIIWLSADIDRLARRATETPGRPALSDQLSFAEIMHRRQPFYEQAADFTVDVEGRDRREIAEELVQRFAPAAREASAGRGLPGSGTPSHR